MTETKGHGGRRAGAGRKPIYGVKMVQANMWLSVSQKAMLQRLGGGAWLRETLDRELRREYLAQARSREK